MERVIQKMRADFGQVASLRRASGDWSAEDEEMAGMAIRAAVDAGDKGLIYCWASWLADLSARDLYEGFSVPPPPPAAKGCDTCAMRRAPGRAEGYCSGREDLASVYGAGHPLRVLPLDGGVSCARWRERT